MNNNSQADQVVLNHLEIPTGPLRLFTILRGIELEVKIPGMRLTRRAPKCSTIIRKEFGLTGKPPVLAQKFKALLDAHGVRTSNAG